MSEQEQQIKLSRRQYDVMKHSNYLSVSDREVSSDLLDPFEARSTSEKWFVIKISDKCNYNDRLSKTTIQ